MDSRVPHELIGALAREVAPAVEGPITVLTYSADMRELSRASSLRLPLLAAMGRGLLVLLDMGLR